MGDVDHQWGSDLSLSSTGDIAVVTGVTLSQERVLRRLMTTPLDYIWQPAYGAGLAGFVGVAANELQVQSVIRGQMFKESSVSQNPQPTIGVTISPGGAASSVYVEVLYAGSYSGQTHILEFSVGP